jgi:hypothetical protein
MNTHVDDMLHTMKAPHVLEATLMTLPPVLGIDDPDEGLTRVMALAEVPAAEYAELESIARKASVDDSEKVIELMRMVMADAAEHDAVPQAEMEGTLDEVGRKQMVLTPDLYYIGVLLVAGYIAVASRGRSSASEKIVIEEMKDGRKKITIEKKEVFLNPFSPLVKLIERVAKKSDGH